MVLDRERRWTYACSNLMKHSGIRIPESTQLWALKRPSLEENTDCQSITLHLIKRTWDSNLSRATAKNFVHSPIFEIAKKIFQEHNVRSKWRIFGGIFLLLTFHCDFTCKFLQPAMCRPQVVVHLDPKVWNPCEEVWTISRHSHAMSWPCWNAGHLPRPSKPSTPTIHANH